MSANFVIVKIFQSVNFDNFSILKFDFQANTLCLFALKLTLFMIFQSF